MPELRLSPGRPTQTAAGLNSTVMSLATAFPSSQLRYRNLMSLVRQIRDYNADASRAISNILRLTNGGWQVHVFTLDGETPDPQGQTLINDFVRIAGREYGGGLDVLINIIHLTAATQGAAALEVELTPNLEPYDFAPVNPWLIDFQKDAEHHWMPGIHRLGSFEPLSPLQFKYIPVDPEPDDPRGRSPFWAALDIVFFQMEVLRDLKAAAHFAGYPRVDISVALEAVLRLIESNRPDLLNPDKAAALNAFMDDYLEDITDMVDDLEPDDAFIHYDAVKAQYVVPSGQTINMQQLIDAIDTQIVSGLKQLPILLGRNESSTTTHATVQWQVFVQELRSYQRISQRILEWGLELVLRLQGRQSVVRFVYDELRTSDRLVDAQAEEIETRTKISQVMAGWVDNDEAAQAVTGHDAVGAPILLGGDGGDGAAADTNLGLIKTGTGGRREVEDINQLPWYQQILYQGAEINYWNTYRAQIRAAWNRMRSA